MGRDDPWRAGVPDLFHRYQDTRLRRTRGRGNGAQFCFLLGGRVDADDLRARLDALLEVAPILGAGLAPYPGARWSPVEGHRIPLREEAIDGSVDAWFSRWFGEPFPTPQRPSFSVVLGRHEGGTAVLLRFLHVLTDAPGMDLLCQILDGADPRRFLLRDSQGRLMKRAAAGRPLWRQVLQVHNLSLRHLVSALVPGVQPRGTPKARPVVVSRLLSVEDSAVVQARAAAMSGALDPGTFFVGLTARAAAGLWAGSKRRRVRIPVPVSLRPPAWRGPVLSNFFTMILLNLPTSGLGSLRQAVQTARTAWTRAFARGEDSANLWFLAAARWLPYPLMRLLLDGLRLRDRSTLFYSYFELKAGRDGAFLGHPVSGFLTASSALSPPGLTLLFARCAGRLTIAVPGDDEPGAQALLDRAAALALGEAD